MNGDHVYEIADDSGFLALINPDTYTSFVDEEWTYTQIMNHFATQFQERRALIWETGSEGMWNVQVTFQPTDVQGIRELIGPIEVTHGRLLLTSYESLTMAAHYADIRLPEPHEEDQLVEVPSGSYRCRIIQVHEESAEDENDERNQAADWIIELVPDGTDLEAWHAVPQAEGE